MILSYTEPFNRYDPHLLPADVSRAIEYFGKFGTLKKLYLNPKYVDPKYKTFLKFDRPDDVEVEEHPGCGSWEIQGEIKEGTKIPEDKKPAGQVPQNGDDKQHGAKGHVKELSDGEKIPAEEYKPSVAHSVASGDNSKLKNGAILTKRCINPAFRKKYPAQNEKLL
jgi:hypothetical protein